MAKKRIQRRRKKSNRKVKENSAYASLCALAPVIADKKVFEPIHENVKIPQKTLVYRPTDRLVFAVVGIISGSETVYDLNQKLRVDRPLLRAFGYRGCADQSVIQETLNASTVENCQQMEASLKTIWDQNNLAVSYLVNAQKEKKTVTIDMDMSGQYASRNAEGSTKGYFAGKKNAHSRQLARVLLPDTQEIVTDYDGRGGVPESSFCQDSQGLSNRKRRKRGFVAQQMLTSFLDKKLEQNFAQAFSKGLSLLNQLAHNMIRWMQNWLIMAVEQTKASPTDDAPDDSIPMEEAGLVTKTLKERGMKRFVRQILSISGEVVMKDQRVLRVILNPSYPLIKRIMIALRALLKPYKITVSLDET